ncbi:riboflavin biosynthesis protein RibD, partial [Pseudoxanthomonas kalamensis DSM 18571]
CWTRDGARVRSGLDAQVLQYMAPLLLGDTARPLLAGLGIEAMAQRVPLQLQNVRQLGEDLRLLLRPAAGASADAASP